LWFQLIAERALKIAADNDCRVMPHTTTRYPGQGRPRLGIETDPYYGGYSDTSRPTVADPYYRLSDSKPGAGEARATIQPPQVVAV
jgi:hypothetical protein